MNKLAKFEKAIKELKEYQAKRQELREAISGYILVSNEKFLFDVVELIKKEEGLLSQ